MRAGLLPVLVVALLAGGAAGVGRHAAEVERLKAEIHTLSPKEIRARFAAIDRLLEEEGPPAPRQSKIEHFVVLLMENHAWDQIFGCMGLPGADGIPPEGRLIPNDPDDPSKGYVNVSCGTAPLVCSHGPGYSVNDGKFKPGADTDHYPYGEQDDKYSVGHGAKGTAVSMFAPEQLPVKRAIAENFGVFNKLYAGVPGASNPNHLFIQSATSCGWNCGGDCRYSNSGCGGNQDTFPQFTIYDSLRAHNVSFALYMNSTCGLPYPNGTKQPACHGESIHIPDAASPIPSPDVAMAGVGRYKANFKSQGEFYAAAAAGTLPAFSWIMPHEQACDHPCHDNAKGERIQKDIYEALRAGPGWGKTLFFVVYDDTGGYYDHIVPPHDLPAGDESPCQCPNIKNGFDFRRLGLRTTSMLMSPWVAKGAVFQEPKGPTNNSQFEHSSVPATAKNLFGLSSFLTKRDAWAGSFDELLLDEARTDAPLHLPDAPAPAKPWSPAHPADWPPTPAPPMPPPPPAPPGSPVYDVVVIEGKGAACPNGFTAAARLDGGDGDLNQGAGGDYIYACTAGSPPPDAPGEAPVTAVWVVSSKSSSSACPGGAGAQARRALGSNGDLNHGAGGLFVYLCVERGGSAPPLRGIGVAKAAASGASAAAACAAAGAGWAPASQGNGSDGDANQGTKTHTASLYICYQTHAGSDGTAAGVEPQHCSGQHGGECRGPSRVTAKQRKNIGWYAALTGRQEPDTDAMTRGDADRWLRARWDEWMARDEL